MYQVISAHLTECKKYIDAEVYYKALGALKEAKSVDTRNIYIIALEKQIKLMSDLSKKRPVDTAYQNEIRGAIPEIIRRAIDDSRKRSELQEADDRQGQETDVDDNPYIRERELALKKLKNQFVTLAEEFINKGDYQSALQEIRRIFIIEPGNEAAQDLERKIESLMNYRSGKAPANNQSEETSDDVAKGKKKRLKLKKAIPLIIAFIVAANIIIFFITSMVSSDAPNTHAIPETQTDNSSTDSYSSASQQNDDQEGISTRSPEISNTLPDSVMRYRNAIAIVNEIEGNGNRADTEHTNGELAESTLTGVTEDVFEELAVITGDEFAGADYQPADSRAQVVVNEPESLLRLEQPVYPAEAVERGIDGNVIIRVLYDAAGTVNVSFVESSDHPLLSESALQSARMSRFTPADTTELDGPQWVSIPYQYRLSR